MWETFNIKESLISKFFNILYPSRCPICLNQSDVFIYSPICSSCWSEIKRYNGPSCKICSFPFSSEFSNICSQCLKKLPPYSRIITFGIYEGILAETINQFKFNGLRRLSKPLSNLLLKLPLPIADAIIPVPLHVKTLRERGFNQSLLLAKSISKTMRIPLLLDTLIKKRATPPQIGLSSNERKNNLKNVFSVNHYIKGLNILLIDDVITTGATITECSYALKKAGAREITIIALARARMY